MMSTVRLRLAGADFHIMGEASLRRCIRRWPEFDDSTHTYPHCGMQLSRNLIVLLKARTAAEDFGQPKLGNGALHVLDLALRGRRGLHPL